MNIVWATVIGLVASIIGGVLASLLVMRKVRHDSKRLYANQIYQDFVGMYYFSIAMPILIDLMTGYDNTKAIRITLTNESNEIDLQPLEDDRTNRLILDIGGKSTKVSVNRFREWLQSDAEQELKRRNEDDIIRIMDEQMQCVEDERGPKSFIAKYPIQSSHFDKLYEVASMIDIWKSHVESLHDLKEFSKPIKPEVSEREFIPEVVEASLIMLDIIERLGEGFSEIEHYRKAKSWTWRLFVPMIHN